MRCTIGYKRKPSNFNYKIISYNHLIKLFFFERNLKVPVDTFKINNITIKNYKKYDSLTIKLNHDFTLIIGGNGSGKTTILDALATLLGVYLQAFKNINYNEIHGIKKRDIKLNITDKNNNIVTNYQTPIIISGNCIMNNQEISLKRIKANINSRNTFHKKENKNLTSFVQEVSSNERSILPIISYHGTGRLWEEASKGSSKMEQLTRLDGYRDCLNAKSNYKNFQKWFQKQELNAFNLRQRIPLLEAVRNIIIQMLTILTSKEIELFIYREGGLEIKYMNEETREKVSNLSDGYRNMIGIVSDIAYRMAILNPQLGINVNQETFGVVLIDEIDLHLHPKWQKKISTILLQLFPKVQFIVTSHSPFIIQETSDNQLIKLEADSYQVGRGNNLSLEDIAEELQLVDNPQWSKKRQKMFTVAREYYKAVKEGVDTEEMKEKLDIAMKPFAIDTAYYSILEQERILAEYKRSRDESD